MRDIFIIIAFFVLLMSCYKKSESSQRCVNADTYSISNAKDSDSDSDNAKDSDTANCPLESDNKIIDSPIDYGLHPYGMENRHVNILICILLRCIKLIFIDRFFQVFENVGINQTFGGRRQRTFIHLLIFVLRLLFLCLIVHVSN